MILPLMIANNNQQHIDFLNFFHPFMSHRMIRFCILVSRTALFQVDSESLYVAEMRLLNVWFLTLKGWR